MSRDDIADVWKRITRLQQQHHLPAYSVLTWETRPALHAHVVFVGNSEIAEALRQAAFGNLIYIEPVTDANKLTQKYLAKERTPQAGYGRRDLGGRIKGSHGLDGGGDRVRLSRELERDAIEAGAVEPWKHTNAKRSDVRKSYRKRPLIRRALRHAGQILLFPEHEHPVARLSQYGGGVMPRSVALEVEHRRKRLGLTQRDFARAAGISQGQYANALRGHDPLSGWVTNRLRERPRARP
jgi:Helix-turn-helix